MKKSMLFSFMLVFSLFSCSGDDDSTSTASNTEEEIETGSEFAGDWSGTYSGNADNGTWEANITDDGVISGTVSSAVYEVEFPVEGTVDEEGAFSATYGTQEYGGSFNGQLTGTSASGTWDNTTDGVNGTWQGEKVE